MQITVFDYSGNILRFNVQNELSLLELLYCVENQYLMKSVLMEKWK